MPYGDLKRRYADRVLMWREESGEAQNKIKLPLLLLLELPFRVLLRLNVHQNNFTCCVPVRQLLRQLCVPSCYKAHGGVTSSYETINTDSAYLSLFCFRISSKNSAKLNPSITMQCPKNPISCSTYCIIEVILRNITILKVKIFGVSYFTTLAPKARLCMFICRKLGTGCPRKFYVRCNLL